MDQSKSNSRRPPPPLVPVSHAEPGAVDGGEPESVFRPSGEALERRSRRWLGMTLGLLTLTTVVSVGVMIAWPRLKPRPLDAVERVASTYLEALVKEDTETARRLSTIEDHPGIRSVRNLTHDRSRDRRLRGPFAPLAAFHTRIDAEFVFDSGAGRFTPKNPLGIAGETLDTLHAAKEDAEKSGLYKKMQSGNPDDLFDAAEEYGKVFAKLADGVLSPKRILPTYKMLVESAKPPLPEDAKTLALNVAESPKQWEALLKRPFSTLKADGPFINEEAEVTATVADRLASLGDPPSRLRLKLVRFRLEGIDTGWKVVSARRIQPGAEEAPPPTSPSSSDATPSQSPRSLHDVPNGR